MATGDGRPTETRTILSEERHPVKPPSPHGSNCFLAGSILDLKERFCTLEWFKSVSANFILFSMPMGKWLTGKWVKIYDRFGTLQPPLKNKRRRFQAVRKKHISLYGRRSFWALPVALRNNIYSFWGKKKAIFNSKGRMESFFPPLWDIKRIGCDMTEGDKAGGVLLGSGFTTLMYQMRV